MMFDQRKIICLTPIRNEEWILERFLRCASIWADAVIILDQCSTDRSGEIARSFDKVKYVRNQNSTFSEISRQRILIDNAREFGAGNVLIALDADEILSANFGASPEWEKVRELPVCTSIFLERVNFAHNFLRCWADPPLPPFGFVDDGGEHSGSAIHTARVPHRAGALHYRLQEVEVLHYQYVDWKRMQSKQRWYQCWEKIQFPDKRPHAIYRLYHHMYSIPKSLLRKYEPRWHEAYEKRGIDMKTVGQEESYWWDAEVHSMICGYGATSFRRVDIWDGGHAWESVRADPRTILDKAVFWYLHHSQKVSRCLLVRLVDRLLFLVGW